MPTINGIKRIAKMDDQIRHHDSPPAGPSDQEVSVKLDYEALNTQPELTTGNQCIDCNQRDFCSYKSSAAAMEANDPSWQCSFKSDEW